MRWAVNVALCGRGEAYIGFWWGNLAEKDQLRNPGVDGRIILRCIFRKWDVRALNKSIWLKIRKVAGNF